DGCAADLRRQLDQIVACAVRRCAQNVISAQRFEASAFVGRQAGVHRRAPRRPEADQADAASPSAELAKALPGICPFAWRTGVRMDPGFILPDRVCKARGIAPTPGL